MSSISVSDSTKAEFDDLKPESKTHDEFVQELLQIYDVVNEPVVVSPEEIAEEIKLQVGSEVELAAYRGIKHAKEETE